MIYTNIFVIRALQTTTNIFVFCDRMKPTNIVVIRMTQEITNIFVFRIFQWVFTIIIRNTHCGSNDVIVRTNIFVKKWRDRKYRATMGMNNDFYATVHVLNNFCPSSCIVDFLFQKIIGSGTRVCHDLTCHDQIIFCHQKKYSSTTIRKIVNCLQRK